MADLQSPRAENSSSSAMNRKKKRKLPDLAKKHDEKASKSSRISQSDDFLNDPIDEDTERTTELLQDSAPWRNLKLVLSLQKKNIDIEKKVELAYKFVKLSLSQVADDTTQVSEAVSFERVIIFLNNWVQSTLISSEKEIRVEKLKPQYGVSGSCLDYRCWEIFKFCLEESTKLHVSMSFARDILKVVHCIAKNTEIKDLNDDESTLYNVMLDCISSVFTSHGGVSNESLDLWILLVGTLLELVLKVINNKLDCSKMGTIVLNWTCLVLEPFAKFLRLHPNRKNGFHDFVDRLLEPFLCLLYALPPAVLADKSAWMSKLLKLTEEVLSQGLFHTSHIDGFLTLQSLAKYKPSDDGTAKDSKTVIKSYHRHFFDRLGRIVVEKKSLALYGEGGLFRLYVHCIKRQEGVELTEGRSKLTDDFSGEMSKGSSSTSSHSEIHHVSALNAEIRKSLFDFFVQIMEPFLGDIDTYLQDEVEVGSMLEDVHRTLKSTNSILVSLMQEKVYVRVDDTSEGACGNFLKLICDKIRLLSAEVGRLVPSTFDVNSGACKELVEVVAKELILCLHYLLEIDYEVLGSDLESLWLLMFSYGTLGHTSTNLRNNLVVIPEILHLGCHMINLYSELRQVGTSVFALCKAIRRMVSPVRDIEATHSESWRSYHEAWTKSLRLIICSPELRLSIHNAVKSIPEGQVSLCIRELATDLSESLEWMMGNSPSSTESDSKNSCDSENSCFRLKAEVLGSGLSEVYALVLDSMMVTTGNSSLVGVSLDALMTVIRPSMSILISQQSDGVYEFLSVVSGRKFSDQDETLPAHWLFLFFFRLYMSCRSSYRQTVSLAPPTASERMSEEMRDSFTAYSGNDWLEKTEKDKGYFSWIVKRPVSLLSIIEAVSGICPQESLLDLSPLTYVLNAMALQRLVDLNRLMNSFAFVIKRNEMVIAKVKEEDGTYGQQNKRLRKCLLKLEEEATGLTNFLMGHLSLLSEFQPTYSSAEDGWNFAVAAIDKKSFSSAFWCIICQNVDIWSTHAAKKKLKTFLSLLLQSSLPYLGGNFKQFGELKSGKDGDLKTVTRSEISLELLSNTMLYEEKFVRRHMASRFCRFLEELVPPLFGSGVDIDLQAQPNWPEVLTSLKIPSVDSTNIRKSCTEQEVDPSIRRIYTVCQSSLDFLCWMPRRCISSKSFSLYATCILNLERLLAGTLLGNNDAPSVNDRYELLQLLLCCRKTLKHLMVTFCEENMEVSQKSLGAIHFGGKFPALWLLNSLLSVQHAFSKDGDTKAKDLMFSLMDYTSYVFLTLTKGSFVHASRYLISAREAFPQKAVPAVDQENLGQSERIEASDFMIHVAEALKDHSQVMITSKETVYCGMESGFVDGYNLQKLSSIISCFQGFLWGLSSTLSHMDEQNINLKAIFLRRNFEPVDKLKLCIDMYTSFISKFLCELVLQDDKRLKASDSQVSPKTPRVLEKRFNLENVDMGSMDINIFFLRSLLNGENLEAAFFLRQLFLAYSALVRLNSQIKTSLSPNLVNIFIGISEILLLEFSNNTGTLPQFSFVFLDGIGKFLEELGNHLSLTNPTLPTDIYERLIDLHLKAIGKCISLQGKEATLESHETESSMKTMDGPLGLSECRYSRGLSNLDELKSRLRMSFKVFVRKPSELYVSSALQSIKKALVGLQKGSMVNYQIYTGSTGGGKASSIVAAGIDCFDLVLEAITGRKNLTTVKTDILGSVSCLFNIITHLQGPAIFYKDPVSNIQFRADPDPGSVALMCIEVLTKVSGKHALYQMDACYVAQALSIPGTLFQNVLKYTTSEAANIESMNEGMNTKLFDRQYSIELYAACCRMLYTFLRHHKRESLQHIALLQASVSVLLHCLEMVNNEQAVRKSYVVWGVQEGAKCGAFLRRIYEEIRQQKDVLGQYCRLFLSSYIVVYSGCGPLKVGIKREVDEALRPGVYALIDACSPDDLQYIHTVLGEGPCRKTLANLQHDYKLNFQYEGKV